MLRRGAVGRIIPAEAQPVTFSAKRPAERPRFTSLRVFLISFREAVEHGPRWGGVVSCVLAKCSRGVVGASARGGPTDDSY